MLQRRVENIKKGKYNEEVYTYISMEQCSMKRGHARMNLRAELGGMLNHLGPEDRKC